MPRLTGVNHLAMATGDMDATIAFWRDLLGLRLVTGLGHPGYRHYFFEISPTDMIAFFEWPGVEPAALKDHGAPRTGPHVFDHVSFGVASDDDLWDIKARLEAAGFWASELIDHGFIHSLYAFDPNNIAIEFSAPVADCDVRRYPVNTDTHPSKLALEGPDPQPSRWPRPAPVPAADREVYPGEGEKIRDAVENEKHTKK